MRTLTLIRHAKSDWSEPGLADALRPLAPRGLAAGPVIATWLGARVTRPDAVLCSSAVRTRATWAMLATAWGEPPPRCTFDDALYMAGAKALLAQIRRSAPTVAHLVIIGHNPALHDLALMLTGQADNADRQALAAKFPTAAVAVFEFAIQSWPQLKPRTGQLMHFVSPRRLATTPAN
jgi:phosphohistidine phosphatase